MLDFGDALRALKQGKRVARKGWNGKNMWIALTHGSSIHPADARRGAAAHLAEEYERYPNGTRAPLQMLTIGAHIDMRAADGMLVVGWLASQTDMLAEDWVILE